MAFEVKVAKPRNSRTEAFGNYDIQALWMMTPLQSMWKLAEKLGVDYLKQLSDIRNL